MDDLARSRRILVVDDSTDTSRLLSRFITLLGHDVRTARDGLEGVEAASEFRPDVVLMDLDMPILDGFDAARRIRDRSLGEQITLVALTPCGGEIDEPRLRGAGFDHHLAKPVDVEALVTLIGRSQPPSG
jgi:CheY-like chemotaxis protein